MRVPVIDITGHRFGALVVLSMLKGGDKGARTLCRCDCGAETEVLSTNLRRGNTKSCGCGRNGPPPKEVRNHRAVEIKRRLSDGMPQTQVALEFGITPSAVSRIAGGITHAGKEGRQRAEPISWHERRDSKGELTLERLRELLEYIPKTGKFRWLVKQGRRMPKVGHKDAQGYIRIVVDYKGYRAHRLAWFYMTGEWPTELIDHINGKRADNRWENLREASPTKNAQNRRRACKGNRSGVLGVAWDDDRGNWRAQITCNGRIQFIGSFDDPHEAHRAYLEAKRKLHEGCTI